MLTAPLDEAPVPDAVPPVLIDTRHAPARRLRVGFICPFDLDRPSGTPVRAKLELLALERQCEVHVVATGGSFRRGTVVPGVWTARPARGPRFELGRFTRGAVGALRDVRPDLLHAIGPYGMLAALRYRAGHRATPIVWEMHGLAFPE